MAGSGVGNVGPDSRALGQVHKLKIVAKGGLCCSSILREWQNTQKSCGHDCWLWSDGLLVMDDGLRTKYLMRLSDVNLCNRHAQVQHRHAVSTWFPIHIWVRPCQVRKVVKFVLHYVQFVLHHVQ